MLADPTGLLRVAASSSEQVRLLELFELQNEEGPCLDVLPHRRAVSVGRPRSTPSATAGRGSRRAPRPPASGRSSRCRCGCADETIGALNLFRRAARGPGRRRTGRSRQAMADVATIGILQERGSQRRERARPPAPGRTEQPHRHRAGQGRARRARRGPRRRGLPSCCGVRPVPRVSGCPTSARRVIQRDLDPADLPMPEGSRTEPR